MPQLPVTTVVTPWLILASISGALEQRAVVVGVDVDEARRDRAAGNIDALLPRGRAAGRRPPRCGPR